MFSDRATKVRKLQGLIDRVIIIDEPQSLPIKCITPILNMLSALVEDWGCSVIFMSATQPVFNNIGTWNFQDIISKDFHRDHSLKRANYKYYPEPMKWKELQNKVCLESMALIIFSTTQNARDFYHQLKVATDKPVLHLSSKMYILHRKQVLSQVRRLLAEDKDFYLISTQVVEAGIDLDFPCVFRQIAPIPSIIQAQGRLNREGKRDPKNSWLHIFNLAEGNILPEDIKGAAISHTLLTQNKDLNDLNDIYYRRYLTTTTDTGEEIEALRYQQKYDQVAEKFNIIENQNTVLVLAEDFLKDYQYKSLTPSDWQILRSYTVNTRSNNYIEWINGILCWNGGYDECGIMI
jgi:CRISPR-associated endonuclease/helicase Cas3